MIFKNYFKLYYWPPLTAVWFMSSFLLTFALSTLQGHVYIYFPYISDTGTISPESCIFGQLMNIGAVIFAITTYIRYRQVGFMVKHYEKASILKKLNTLGVWCGFIVSLGISMVGNFQETNILVAHFVGSSMTFGIGTLYLAIQSLISFLLREFYYKHPEYRIGPKIIYFRIILVICCSILCVIAATGILVSLSQFTGESIAWWTEEHGGFQYRIVATFSEWILAILFIIFIATLTNEYKLMEYEEVRFNNYQNWEEKDQENTKI